MKKRILWGILWVCIILTSCKKTENVSPEVNTEVINTPIEDKYEITALNSDKQGIDKSTVFQLTSHQEINDNFIKNNLQIIPNQEYKIEKLSATVHNIIPATSLENDKVYQIEINDKDYDYSWAFQTKKKFEVESTIPANESSYVPANSGIEMYFSLIDFEEIDNYFEIKPHVDGKFIYKDNAVIFVPNLLEENIKYTVTIKKGFGLKDGDEKLEEDYTFSFSTSQDRFSQLYFEEPLTNIYENNPKAIMAYTNEEDRNIEYNIDIYKYNNSKSFEKNIKDFADTGKFVNDEDGIENNNELVKINTIKQKPVTPHKTYYGQNSLFELPQELPKGYYLLEVTKEGGAEKTYHFIQINDMLVYYAFFNEQLVVFAADAKDSKGIIDAAVIINDEHLGFTDNDGMLVVNKDTSVYEGKSLSLRVEAKGYNDFINADSFYFGDYFYRSEYEAYEYLRYIDTDRPVYLPTDKINVWGFARHKNNKSINQVKIELVEAETNLVLEEKTVKLSDIGTYQTEFEIKNITSENCVINVYDNDNKISTEYISIGKYTKPLYTLSGEFNKKFVYSGEDIEYKVNANFFDGYPAPNLDVKYYTSARNYSGAVGYSNMDSNVKLDENGEAVISVNTNITSDNWRPVTINMSCWNATAEDKNVENNNIFEIFPRNQMLEIEQNDVNNPDSVDILLHELVNTKYNSPDYKGYEDLRGNPLSASIAVDIDEVYHEKVKVGEHYDYINKVNVAEYKYNLVKNRVYSEGLNTVDGYVNIKIPNFNSERTYEVTAYYGEGINGNIREVVSVGALPYYYERLYYSLEQTDDKKSFRLNDNVNLQLMFNNERVENIENDNLVLLLMRNGLVDYKTTKDTNLSLTFNEDYIPNVFINSVYIKNGYLYPLVVRGSLVYDITQKQIYFDVTTDKEEYRPGEEVVLNVKARDEYNNPCIADVNISVVDEAYFAVFEKYVDTLRSLYQRVWNSGLNAVYLSNIDLSVEKDMAEMGGGGGDYLNFRDEFKDTNIFKTITTDKNGNASLKFKLADNLTSWRITYQGISSKQYAGSGTKNITVSLPFYVDLIMGKEYLKEDKISASLRVFGTEAKTSEQVKYEVRVKNIETGKELKYSQDGVIGSYTNIPFDKLDVGHYEIYVYAKYKDFEDGIKENFNVVDSSIYFNNTDYYKLSDNTILEEVYSNPVITLFNESTSDFYNSLNDISANSGKRIDQTVCSLLATKYINEYFKADLPFDEDLLLQEINKYEAAGGGLKLLTYSEADVELTAKLMNIVNDEYLDTKAKKYFKRVLVDNKEYNTDIAAALWGLSKYKEPVLLTIYDLLENNSLEARDKIYLSLALVELGDMKASKKVCKELADNLLETGELLYFESNADERYNYTEDYELTALLSVLGVKLRDYDTSDKLFKYIYHNPSKYTLSNLEQLIYIMNRDIMKLQEIKDLFGEVAVTANGIKETYKLKLFDRESFSVPKEKIKDVKFSKIKGSIACKVDALGNKDDLEKNKTDDFSIGITYALKTTGKEQKSYNHSDVVKVTIMPSYSPVVERGNFEITYVVPAGFRYIEKDNTWPFWVEENGQKLKLNFYYDKQNFAPIPITFYIQAAQTGEYTVDYVVIKENLETKLNYLNKDTLTVN